MGFIDGVKSEIAKMNSWVQKQAMPGNGNEEVFEEALPPTVENQVELAQEACEQHAIDIADPSSVNLQNQVQVGEEANESNTEPEEANPDNIQEEGTTSDHYSEANPATTDPTILDQQDHSEDPAESRRSKCKTYMLISVFSIFVQLIISNIPDVLYRISVGLLFVAFLCCIITFVPVLFTPWERHIVFGSVVMLMCALFTPMLQANWLCVLLAAPFLILALAMVGFVYYKGFFRTDETNDSRLDLDQNRAGNFCLITLAGLVGTGVGYLNKSPHQNAMEIKLAELLLILSILAGLIVLQHTAFKPVFRNEGRVERAVTAVLNYLPRILNLLLELVAFAAAAEELRSYVVISGLFIIVALWIVLELFSRGLTTNQAGAASAAAASQREAQVLAFTASIFAFLFGFRAYLNGSGNHGSSGLQISCFLLLFGASYITLTYMHLMRAPARWACTATKILSYIGPLVVFVAAVVLVVQMMLATNNGARVGAPTPAPYHR